MKHLEKLIELGEKLGYSGENLQDFVESKLKSVEPKQKADTERAERLAQRQEACEAEQRKENEAARKHEKDMLELKKHMAENDEISVNPLPNNYNNPKIPAFEENRDNLDSYLERFERFAKGQKWDPADWAIRLSALLKGGLWRFTPICQLQMQWIMKS